MVAGRTVGAHECRYSSVSQLETRECEAGSRARNVHIVEYARTAYGRPQLVEPDQGHNRASNRDGQASDGARREEPDAQAKSAYVCR